MSEHQLDRALIERMVARLSQGRARLVADLRRRTVPIEGGPEYVRAASLLIDTVVADLADAASTAVEAEVGPSAKPLMDAIAVVGVGGYGRQELCPESDVDLLFLVPPGDVDRDVLSAFIDRVLYGLWDLGLELGHAVRTVEECVEFARADQSVKTGLVDARLIPRTADQPWLERTNTFRALELAVEREFLTKAGAKALIEQKIDEARERDQRFGNTVYMLEPDVKSGEGGLRELHTALWVARARWRTRTVRDLLRAGVLSSRETRTAERAYAFLLRVRTELHLTTGRRREGLGFDLQEAIAKTLGYPPTDDSQSSTKRRTERFMRAYYFHAGQNRRVAKLIIERATSHPPRRPATVIPTSGGFKTFGGMLTVGERTQFENDPSALVRIFRVAQEESYEIYSYTKDLIAASLGVIDRDVRRAPNVVADLLAIFENPVSNDRTLEQMHELGLLTRLIPEFARVRSRWQHSLYHVYTVDVHTLFVIQALKQIRLGEMHQSLTELTRRHTELPRPSVLYLAAFLHDVGKGWRRGDHSTRGASVSRTIGARLEQAGLDTWTSEETDDLVWLVQNHLLMSDISQRRDLDDPELIATFANECGTVERLSMLWLLTVADMKATSPKVWTAWKATLLQELFDKTRSHLTQTARQLASGLASHTEARRRRLVDQLIEEAAKRGRKPIERTDLEAFVAAVPNRYVLAVPRRQMLAHVQAWREMNGGRDLWLRVDHHRRDRATELTVLCHDRAGLLALLAGVLSANRLQILSAQIFSVDLPTGGRVALDVLFLTDADGTLCEEPARWVEVRKDLEDVLVAGADVEQMLEARVHGSTLPERPRPHVETKIVIAHDASRSDTVIDVFCADRLGVLHTIAKAFADEGLTINVAKISTQGGRVADGFYVTDASGAKLDRGERLTHLAKRLKDSLADA